MSIYILLYFVVIILLLYVGSLFYRKYRNIWWLGFLFFTIFASIRFVLYFLSFFTTKNIDILLQIWRWAYWLALLSIYSLVLFILYFEKINKNVQFNYYIKGLTIFIVLFSILTIFSPYIIESMYFNIEKKDYYEKTGIIFNLYLFVQLMFFPIFTYSVLSKYKKLNNINKVRLKYILLWAFIFVLLAILFQLFLPTLWIYILEKEVILFILPLVFFTWYSITRYYFTDFSFRYKNILAFLLSVFITVVIFIFSKSLYLSLWDSFIKYWWIENNFTYIDLVFWIIMYIILYKIFMRTIPWNAEYKNLINIFNRWKDMIPFITSLKELNNFLSENVKSNFGINYINIKTFNNKSSKKLEIEKFFAKNIFTEVFINDIVFIEENKNKFDKNIIKKELNKNISIIFPLFNNQNMLVGILELWHKPFKEQFYSEEIKIIREFVDFLVWHLKYIWTYSKLEELNLTLDKKVDEKTIEYNELLNKQNEFIGIVSHEIKTPLSTCIFQVDSLIDDIDEWEDSPKYIKKELREFEEQLQKMSWLTNSLFVNQRYDLWRIKLFKEKEDLRSLLTLELEVFKNKFENVTFKLNITSSVWIYEIDKVQFTQVINNLLNNAVRFANKNKKLISLKAYEKTDYLIIDIEDNWKWFWKNIDTNLIFEKYNTWKQISVWIGMWLYLCHKIITLHGWEIRAMNSEKFWWAKFHIKIRK